MYVCVCVQHLLYVLIMVLRRRSGIWKAEGLCTSDVLECSAG